MLFFSDFLFAQVRIKEKVVINPQQSLQNLNIIGPEGTEGIVSGFVMKKRGMLQVYYSFAGRDSSPIPYSSHLRVDVRNGDTILTDFVVPRFSQSNSYLRDCFGNFTSRYNYSISDQPFSVIPVQRGDSVIFVYVTDLHPVDGIMDTLGISSTDTTQYGWDATFHTQYICREEILPVFIGVLDTVIKFTQPASDSICPNITDYNDNSTRRNWIDLELKATFDGIAMQNVWVKVDTAAIADSGGHSHNGNRPMGKYRVPKLPPASGYDTVSTFKRKTDSTGVLKFRYLASQFGGIEKITAKLLSDTTSFDTLRIKVKVDSLYDFSTLSSDYWVLTGNSGITTYGRCIGNLIKHYDNHWFHPECKDSLGSAIRDFYEWSGTDSGGGISLKLRINDMSLKFGGLFDICSDWRAGHFYHRTGNSVDISKSAIRSDNDQLISLSRIQIIELERIMKRYSGKRYQEPSIHFGFGGKY